ncbi:MAG TPA: SDR family oxidoreductase [Novosphingobium sp.]|jgi:NAD(P)-dependent dehydrogenase (short-subunit alcohol dehydrogenase family)
MGELTGKVAIITGASQGIGEGMAIAFGEAGASVVCAARNMEKLRNTCAAVEAAGGKAIAVSCDVRERNDIEACIAKAVEVFGGIDIMVNNAQTIQYVFMRDATDQTMVDTLHSGPLASYRFMQAAYPHMIARGGGVVVNVGSPAQHLPVTARYACYNAAKCAIEGLTRAASDEWKGVGIYTFMIYPQAETAMVMGMKAREPERYAAIVADFPKGRMGDPLEDIGRPMVNLIGMAEKLSGKTIRINSLGVGEITEVIGDVPFDL